MKLSHNIKSPRPSKNLGLHTKLYDSNDKQLNFNLTPKKLALETTELSLGSSRGPNIKVAPINGPFTYSQVIDRSQQYAGRPERDQIERISIAQNYGSNHDLVVLKQDVNSLKELMQNPMGSANFLYLKQQIMQDVAVIIEQHKMQSAKSLREALLKIDDNMKKQCVTQLSRQFLPLSFLDDSERQFQQLQTRIGRLENIISQQNTAHHLRQSMKPFQQQLKKHEVETFEIKSLIKQLEESFKIKESHIFASHKQSMQKPDGNIELKVDRISKAAADLQKQLKDMLQAILSVKLDQQRINSRVKFLEQSANNSLAFQKQHSKHSRTQKSKQLRRESNIQSIPSMQSSYKASDFISYSHPYKSMSLTFSMESLNDLLKPQPINSIPGSIGSIKDIKSSKYILDNDNHLMDDTGNYILDEEGNQIKLTQQQIQIIRDSNVLKFKQV